MACQEESMSHMVHLVNNERRKAGVRDLVWDSRLAKAAQDQCNYMASYGLTHENHISGSIGTRVSAHHFLWSGCAENIAHGHEDANAAIRGWLNSEGHRKNMLNPNYTHFGAGFLNGYWAQVFGREM
ncbi:5475_t:CDS:2 [Acaulospora morrowiae]|uniref:5475_t:CDS:1 n=1 Tax=Acaulospora morrowiae TaxID=94023 RepID=A0A9N8YP34_9GLOM|nr:5475_t:CDS:2 [Acaulospora morrowiae]